MNAIQARMIKKAERMHKRIFPCAEKNTLDECFTKNNDFVFFWYNTEDQSTHVLTESLKKRRSKTVATLNT